MLKKLFCILLISLIVLTGCGKREERIIEAPKVLSKEEIIEQNKTIDDSDINLVQFRRPVNGDTIMTLATTAGDIHFILYPQYAPVAYTALVDNINAGVYRDVTIDQVVNNFYFNIAGNEAMAPEHKGYIDAVSSDEETASTNEEEKNVIKGVENTMDLWHFKGALAMRDNLKTSPESSLADIFVVGAFNLNEEIIAEMERIGYPEKVLDKYKKVGGIPGYDTNYTVVGQVYYGMDIVDKISSTRVMEDFIPKNPINVVDIYITTYDSANPPERVKEILAEGEESGILLEEKPSQETQEDATVTQ